MKWVFALMLTTAVFILTGCGKKYDPAVPTIQPDTIVFDKSREMSHFPDYIETLKQYAKRKGINNDIIEEAFSDIHYIEHVIVADKNQPEKKLTIDEYLTRVITPARIELAKQKYTQFYADLTQATMLTGVPQNYILALWGIESGYGKYQGKEDIISALSTLAFDGRRENFFVKELIAALTILQNQTISKSQFKGSWAGAMGQNQFMPSSYLAYGLDGNNDGIIDIWNDMDDIFASTGNYLSTIGWDNQTSWGKKIKLPKDFDLQQAGLENDKVRPVADWLTMGIQWDNDKKIPNAQTPAWIIVPDIDSNNGYLVYQNFKTLMHWNHSYYFAISVGMVADSLADIVVKKDEVVH